LRDPALCYYPVKETLQYLQKEYKMREE
jgi:hypothetical protein